MGLLSFRHFYLGWKGLVCNETCTAKDHGEMCSTECECGNDGIWNTSDGACMWNIGITEKT